MGIKQRRIRREWVGIVGRRVSRNIKELWAIKAQKKSAAHSVATDYIEMNMLVMECYSPSLM